MRHYRYTIILMVIILFVLACNLSIRFWDDEPTPTAEVTTFPGAATAIPEPPPGADEAPANCLVGEWRIDDISPYVIASVPAELASEYNLEYTGSSGNITVRFEDDGDVEFNANQIELKFSSRVAIISIPVNVNLDGRSRGEYTDNGQGLRTENMDTSGLSASATAAGQDVLERDQILQSLPLVSPYYPSAQYTCGNDQLRMTVDNYPGDVPALVFERVQ